MSVLMQGLLAKEKIRKAIRGSCSLTVIFTVTSYIFFPRYLKLHDGSFLNHCQCLRNMIGCSLGITDTILVAQNLADTV